MKKSFAILVGGGPAPGINGVISAATIEATNRGYKVLGIKNGFELIMKGESSAVSSLVIDSIVHIESTGGSILGTSRANPQKSAELLTNVVNTLIANDVGYLITIGGDDTASSADAIAEASKGKINVAHVPKTIDNDLPLPGSDSTFGFQTARQFGSEIVENLMIDAKSSGRWYFVVAMGRKAGHLALGMGFSASATLTLIPEEFGKDKIPLSKLVDILAGSILLRVADGKPYGVAVLAEGLAEKLLEESLPQIAGVEKDPHGHVRYAELDFGGIIKNAVKDRLKEWGVSMTIVSDNVGYELRCRAPISFDREYTRELGFGAVDFLASGGSAAMITRQDGKLTPLPFKDFMDAETGKSKVRYVETDSQLYKIARNYMIRLGTEDLKNPELMKKLSKFTKLTAQQLSASFKSSM
jgi:6-phosphofructokinase